MSVCMDCSGFTDGIFGGHFSRCKHILMPNPHANRSPETSMTEEHVLMFSAHGKTSYLDFRDGKWDFWTPDGMEITEATHIFFEAFVKEMGPDNLRKLADSIEKGS